MTEKQVIVRVKVDGSRVTQTFKLYGKEGEEAMARIRAGARAQTAEIDRAAQSFRKTTGAASNFAGGIRGVSLQLSQVAQQATATGDPLRALAIQLPDLGLAFGTVGIVVGALAGAALPALVEMIAGSGEEAKALEKRMKALGDLTKAYGDAVERTLTPVSELVVEFGSAADEAKRFYEQQERLARSNLVTALREARGQIVGLIGDMGEVDDAAAMAFSALERRAEDLRRNRFDERGIDTLSAEQLRELESIEALMRPLAGTIGVVRREFGLSSQAAADFVAEMARFRDAADLDAQIAAAVALREQVVAVAEANGGLSGEQEAFAGALKDAIDRMLELKALSGDVGAGVSGAAGEAGRLADEMGRAARAAVEFVAGLRGGASLAGLRAEVAALESGLGKVEAGAEGLRAALRDDPGYKTILSEGTAAEIAQADALVERRVREFTEQQGLLARQSAALRELSKEERAAAGSAEKLSDAQRLVNRVLGDARMPEIAAEAVAILDRHLDAGRISMEEYARAVEKVNDAVSRSLGGSSGDASLARYAEDAKQVADDISQALVSAFGGAEDAIREFVMTGKLEFSDLVRSILADLAVIAARKFILGPLADGLDDALTGVFSGQSGVAAAVLHAGGVAGGAAPSREVPALAFAGAPRLHSGGALGLRPDEVPAILQKGETVLPRGARAAAPAPVNVTIVARDAESFRQGRTQIAADMARAVSAGRRGM